MDATLSLLNLAGAIALLLWGVHMVQSGVQPAFGPDLRRFLAKTLDNRIRVAAAGLDSASPLAAAQTEPVKQKLADNTAVAVERGVFGLPAFFVGKEMFWGKERLGQVEEAVAAKAAP